MEEKSAIADNLNDDDYLKQLLDTSYPLLQEFREACPGTYKHSQALSVMMEGMSESLGLNVNLMKVCAIYHDVGKMFNPKYFTENQQGEDENPHDSIAPEISYEIITRHVSDTAVILVNDHNFPRKVIEVTSQHHGNTVLRSFYNRSEDKDESIFKYKTSKPGCIESAVLMITDQVEATSRAMTQGNKFNASEVIDGTINRLLDSGELDSVYMKLGDLKIIKESLHKEISGMFQKRVDYAE